MLFARFGLMIDYTLRGAYVFGPASCLIVMLNGSCLALMVTLLEKRKQVALFFFGLSLLY